MRGFFLLPSCAFHGDCTPSHSLVFCCHCCCCVCLSVPYARQPDASSRVACFVCFSSHGPWSSDGHCRVFLSPFCSRSLARFSAVSAFRLFCACALVSTVNSRRICWRCSVLQSIRVFPFLDHRSAFCQQQSVCDFSRRW